MTTINAYLNFDGNCREAMTFYQECLGGDLTIQTVGDSPIAGQMPAEAKDAILHAGLTKGETIFLMASDMMRGSLTQGNSVTLSVNCTNEEETKSIFTNLSAGGKIIDPLAMMFWGALFGSLTDKFGMNWIVNHNKN